MTYNLHFNGSLSDMLRQKLPQYSGIYLVYRGRYDTKENLFYCREILYIGQAQNIRERIVNHDRRLDFLAECGKNEILFYSYAPLHESLLNMIENALIYVMKPRLNTLGKESYLYPSIQVVSDGACSLLDTNFEIK